MKDNVTVIIPTSPIISNPDTKIIDTTIESVLFHFHNSKIIIACDGVRSEQNNLKANYEEYKERLFKKYPDIKFLVLDEYGHESTSIKKTLKLVKTDLILLVEHDMPLVTDMPIEWEVLIQDILDGEHNIIRLSHESNILKVHEYLMLDKVKDKPILNTIQYSSRPQLASANFYRKTLDKNFSKDAKAMIEVKLHGLAQNESYDEWKIGIYTPKGNICRCYHLDGRQNEPTFEESYTF